ncbi:unnamed protein product [Caenorhabditis nigoni]
MPCWTEDHKKIQTTKVLVVGAGGIGCELLKNLAATGFKHVHVIDLDTIDVSNLNRQFLFRKEHVSSSKAEIATRVIKKFNPDINLTFDHSSIFEERFNIEFYRNFDIVLNALDNKQARNHVNRMCHSARTPLVESGSAGFFGQVQVILKGKTECYECQEKPKQKTFPGCTIRNTPSEHIHCTVWAKHVFSQLFGEVDIDDDVSPDLKAEESERPEADSQDDEAVKEPAPIGTRQWAESVNFDAEQIFNKLFVQDIHYLLKINHLWKTRKPPTPLSFSDALKMGDALPFSESQKNQTAVWSIATCVKMFEACIQELRKEANANPDEPLSFDKDHPIIMSFVAACANVRAHIFNILTKTAFEIKAMAGNIIPAIASTNAIVAGMIVTEAVKIIEGREDEVKNSVIMPQPTSRGQVFMFEHTNKPNPRCYVCSDKKEVFLYVNLAEMTLSGLCEKVLKQELNMLAPDAIESNTNSIVLSSDGETDPLMSKKLAELSIMDGSILACDDFMQDFDVKVFICKNSNFKGDQFEIVREMKKTVEKEDDEEKKSEEENKREDEDRRKRKVEEESAKVDDEPEIKRNRVEEVQAQGIEVME